MTNIPVSINTEKNVAGKTTRKYVSYSDLLTKLESKNNFYVKIT